MKNIVAVLILVSSLNTFSQILEPVQWSTSVHKNSDTEYELIATASIENGWHLYSQEVPEDGPIPTRFSFKGSNNYLKKGNTSEAAGHTVHDPVFEMQITYFETKAVFKQKIKVMSNKPFNVKGNVEFMVCDDIRCLPPTIQELTFMIP
ncbi:protein-disulfide reductase DsbD domain-containing protein [Sinomicrobium sp. M5D2P9]